ncbi:hypothetical protein BD410DRAFT_494115 [Rickenella mellea]|uniref:Uncharacterized protein n=1 Tax=Rickenella mellea TaxID=50990 RepID=A0A4Y7PVP2_9AGAM|nr:hypothetical protein BD410DRAFT_494115 [Rickenella mellea]
MARIVEYGRQSHTHCRDSGTVLHLASITQLAREPPLLIRIYATGVFRCFSNSRIRHDKKYQSISGHFCSASGSLYLLIIMDLSAVALGTNQLVYTTW